MKRQIECIEAYEVEFTKEGSIFRDEQVRELESRVAAVTDLIVMSHGWNNDMAEARLLYTNFFTELCRQLGAPPAGRSLVALTVLWPSKKFADRDLIPGGGATAASLADEALERSVAVLKEVLPDPGDLERAQALFERIDEDEQAQRQFVDLLRSGVPRNRDTEREDGLQHLFNTDGDEILRRLQRPIAMRPRPTGDDENSVSAAHFSEADDRDLEATRGAGLGDTLQGMKGAALRFANLITYYAMKERAGIVGANALNPVLQRLLVAAPNLRLHLIGHSFGGRLVAATASAQRLANLRSITLLQAAFSHYGFAREWEPGQPGAFRIIVDEKRVDGPILVTQSIQDIPVGVAYAIASKISGSIGAGLADSEESGESPVAAAGILDRITSLAGSALRIVVGGPNDRYGGIGRNGALGLGPDEVLKRSPIHPQGVPYDFSGRGQVYNLVADECVKDHGDVYGKEVVYAVLQAITRG